MKFSPLLLLLLSEKTFKYLQRYPCIFVTAQHITTHIHIHTHTQSLLHIHTHAYLNTIPTLIHTTAFSQETCLKGFYFHFGHFKFKSVIFFRLYSLPSSWRGNTGVRGQGRRTWRNVMNREVTMQGDGWRTSSATGCFLRLLMRIMQTSVPSLLVNIWSEDARERYVTKYVTVCLPVCLPASLFWIPSDIFIFTHSWVDQPDDELWYSCWAAQARRKGKIAVQDIMTLPSYHVSVTLNPSRRSCS